MHDATPAIRSLHQIVDKDGKPYTATATGAIWVGYDKQQFAEPTSGNAVVPYTTGKAYFAAVREAIENATEEILIAGWQVNWDAMLAPGVRLFDVLLTAARKGTVQICVMPWDDTAPVQTFDDQTESVLLIINKIVGKKVIHVCLAGSLADESKKFFSHHQKLVVVDRKTAFVGGIDLAYGRYDDASFDLRADSQGRESLNRYNGCIAQTGKADEAKVVDPDLLTGAIDRIGVLNDSNRTVSRKKILAGAWQAFYVGDIPITIDPATQPRMPWQDVHARIEGPAVSDLARNFIDRWNCQGGKPRLKPAKPASQYPKPGSCQIQVLRSAPNGLRTAEYKFRAPTGSDFAARPERAQDDIMRAMMELIHKAEHFIYIENQFFVSDFGQPQGFDADELSGPAQQADRGVWMDQTTGAYVTTTRFAGDRTTASNLPQNQICAAIASRIDTAIRDVRKHPIHVIITLPVHSEGALNNGSIMTQVHWTMQSLVFGSHSLLNRIRRSLKAQQLREKKDPNPDRVYAFGNNEYEDIPVEECFKYVTLLNLRNWAKLDDRYITEQVYVHSKLMIVDDRYAILGSANINDRSLLGTRDSELAVLVVDDKVERKDICGDGKLRPVRGFAHELRQEVWRKIFGITGKVRQATELQSAIDHPGAPENWKAIQKVARANTKLYEEAFPFIPRNKDPNTSSNNAKRPASIWPTWTSPDPDLRNMMPFMEKFWTKAQRTSKEASALEKVKGFITLLPIEWTKDENNNFGYHMGLVVHNDQPGALPPEINERRHVLAGRSQDAANDKGGKAA